ncbi:VOC family protein [Aspergillus clavatus NRRL 1]|uniref:Glyoxalase family protein n=1 Tax=Aspergillus clavatus (strain ATCC 1007 / CBS 513.65 / DSM 816 / NCTC 3887 / NRRL 1 / QM 1276 / 107) TaxID=344612 RepID=A1C4I4_ASPCL|nr:glyoxalase family protein [Aspergillus clavatus NRRL 1]EAW15324.1 glyoxalase family protein [Aspergillus clavatus NRRL 1]
MSSNIDHISISAPKEQFEAVVGWYKAALAPLKYRELERLPKAVGLGAEVPDLWVVQEDHPVHQGLHFALMAPDHATVDAFYQAAVAAGGVDNGKPGVHPEYDGEYYYGSFVLDPLGNNVEVVDHCSHEVEYR